MLEFQLNTKINYPKRISIQRLKQKTLVIAVEKANWLVLNSVEFEIFMLLHQNYTLEKCLLKLLNKTEYSERKLRLNLKNLLTKTVENNFFEDAQIEIAENPKTIEKVVHINITHSCNLRCIHCFLSAGEKLKDELSISDWKIAIENLSIIPNIAELVFSGGEPLIIKNILEIAKFSEEKGFRIILFSNGTLINETNIHQLKIFDEIQISLDGISEDINDKVRGKGSYQRIINAIQLIKKARIKLAIGICIMPINYNDICLNLIDFVKKLDYDLLDIRINTELDKEGNALNLDDSFFKYNYSKLKKISYIIFQLEKLGYSKRKSYRKNTNMRNCGIGLSIGINSNGDIYPCDKMITKYGNILQSNFKETVDNLVLLNKETEISNIEKCSKCDLKLICLGKCRIKNLLETGSMLVPNCNLAYKKYMYNKLIYNL